MLFQQRDAPRQDWEGVGPGQRTDYAWDQPMGSHRLCVSVRDTSAAFRDVTTHEYSLDVIRVSSMVSPALLGPGFQTVPPDICLEAAY